jgi:hypothetical protein
VVYVRFMYQLYSSHRLTSYPQLRSVTTVQGNQYQARFWYDGDYIAQAREDSAEMALRHLTGTVNTAQEPPPASYYSNA